MSVGLLGKKIGMTRVYDSDGVATAVTVVHVEPNVVTQLKTKERDGYHAVQLAVGKRSKRQIAKPLMGHLKKAGIQEPKAFVREFRLNPDAKGQEQQIAPGQLFSVNQFSEGQFVDIIGQSKGKGFQGVMRKHGFAGQADSHGSTTHRRNGAIGCRSTPGRVFKNMGMPGHMGDDRITVQNLKVVQVREADHALLIKGAIPGANGSYVVIRKAIKTAGLEKRMAAAAVAAAAKAKKAAKKK